MMNRRFRYGLAIAFMVWSIGWFGVVASADRQGTNQQLSDSDTVVAAADPSLRQYPVRPGALPSSSYTLSVNGQSVFVEKFGDISFARFAFSGNANVQVKASEAIASFGISPQSDQINGSSTDDRISFSIDQPKSLIVSVNNLEKLFLFADGMESDAPDIQDPNVIRLADYLPANRDEETEVTEYFQQAIDDTSAMNNGAGGILYVPDGKYMTAQLRLKSNVHLYLQDGAWIRAVPQFNATNYPPQNGSDSSFIYIGNASHVKISGRGIIDGNGMAVRTANANANLKLLRTSEVTDLQIEDVYFLDSARWTLHLLFAQDVVLKNIKLINDLRGAPDPNDPNVWIPTVTNTDGVDIDASQNVTVDGAFIYTGDDAISPKVTNYMNLQRPTLDLQIKNNVIWSLKSALKVGDETLMDIGQIHFDHNDIVHADRFIALWNREESRIHDIEAIDNRAEFIGGNYNERYFYFRIRARSADSKPGWIDQVHVKDFYVLNKANQPSSIEGYDSSHLVTNVTFENIVINGNQAAGIADIPLDFKNEFYDNVVFQPSGTVYNGNYTADDEPRILLVDQRGLTSGAYKSIAEAVDSTPALKPGDTISLVPGSGPYHETIRLHASGAEGNPIIFDGNGELISGFAPFQFTQESNGQWTYTLPEPIANTVTDGSSNTFRHLIAYNGQRLLLDQAYGQNAGVFTSDYAVLSSDGSKLILNPDKASPTSGWEISTQENGVEIVTPDSYQTYRNLRITGVQNDGFNVHGTGTGLVFENVEAYNNFDEGFSSHDSTSSTIDGGKFWGNDNGIYNMSRDTVTFAANDVQSYNNIGYGIATQMGTNTFSNVQVWDNGISNIRVGGRVATSNVVTYESRWSQRPWVGYQETQNYKYNQQIKPYAYSEYAKTDYPIEKSGTPPTVMPASELPPFKGSFDDWRHIYFSIAQQSDPNVSGPDADPDGDGLDNRDEYEEGLNPNVPDQESSSANTSLEGPTSVQAGQALDLTYGLHGVASSVYAQQVTVSFNPDQLQYVGADSLLDDFEIVDSKDDNGRVDLVVAGKHSSVTGSADMLTLHFRALEPTQTESSQVYISQAVVSDQNGKESELNVGPAYVVQIIVAAADKTELQARIAEAQTRLNGASLGDHWGQYGQQAVDAFNIAIRQAITINNNAGATQLEVDQAAADLAAAIQAFVAALKTTASIGDLGIMAFHYGLSYSDADWPVVKRYDLNGDNRLDIEDLTAMAKKMLGHEDGT